MRFLGLFVGIVNAVPLFVWTNSDLGSSPEFPAATQDILPELKKLDCHKVSLLVDDVGLQRSSLHVQSPLSSAVSAAKSLVAIPYINQENVPSKIEQHLRDFCGSKSIDNIGQIKKDSSTKFLMRLDAKSWEAKLNELVDRGIDNFIVFYTSSASPARSFLEKRAVNFTTLPFAKRPLFQRFYFFNKAIWHAMVVLLILVPILYYAILGVASVKAPTRFEGKRKGE